MPNIKCVIEYNGLGFNGWQTQPGLRTVQEELHKAIEIVTRDKIREVIASGRTDSGVHAKAQVINFYLPRECDLQKLRRGVSSLLNGEVSLISAEVVPDQFNSRANAISKTYVYTLLYRDTPPTLERGFVWHMIYRLDLAKMQREAKLLEGQHDFTSFRGANCTAASTVRKIFESELIVELPHIYYRVRGEGFLKQMVRNIVGTLVQIGRGQQPKISSFEEILAARDRRVAGPTAPAHGLCLEKVEY